jgi:hypothetical protein
MLKESEKHKETATSRLLAMQERRLQSTHRTDMIAALQAKPQDATKTLGNKCKQLGVHKQE